MKVCAKCKRRKPLTAFSRKADAGDGRCRQCRECARKYDAAYYVEHAEKRCASHARYCADHSEEQRAYAARYYQEHREKCLVWQVRWRKEHAAERRAYRIRYDQAHPELSREHDRRRYQKYPELYRERKRRRRARKRAVSETFTIPMEQFVYEFWGYRCVFCGAAEKLCIDHWLPLFKGYALAMDNAVLLCQSCNSRKGTKLPEELDDQKQVTTIKQRLTDQAGQWVATEFVAAFFAV